MFTMARSRLEFTPEHKDEARQTKVTESERAELLRLRKENADLKMDRTFLKKASIFFTVTRMVHLLESSRSCYYVWLG